MSAYMNEHAHHLGEKRKKVSKKNKEKKNKRIQVLTKGPYLVIPSTRFHHLVLLYPKSLNLHLFLIYINIDTQCGLSVPYQRNSTISVSISLFTD